MMPQRLDDLADQYNELVDKFNTAVKMTTVAYLHVGPKSQNMPLTMTYRSVNGIEHREVSGNDSSKIPYLYDPETKMEKEVTIIGYESPNNGDIFVHKLRVFKIKSEDDGSDPEIEITVNYDMAIESFLVETGQTKATGNIGDPAINVQKCEVEKCTLQENTTYKIAANQAGGFKLQSIRPEDHTSTKLPTNRPKFVKYEMEANTTISSSPF